MTRGAFITGSLSSQYSLSPRRASPRALAQPPRLGPARPALPALLALLALAALAAACSFSPPEGAAADEPGDDDTVDPTDPDGDGVRAGDNCPDDANADQRDGDSDGVGDACDNCAAVANPAKETLGFDAPIQRDHDLDGRGDECDLCPHLASAEPDADQDADAIGDACDPEPTAANPAPYWNGFYDAPGDDWKAANMAGRKDDWELAARGGELGWRQKVLDDRRHQLLLDGEREEHFVQSRIVVDAINPAVTLPSATLTVGFYRESGNDYSFSCGARRDTSANTNLIVAAVQRDGSELNSNNTAWPDDLVGVAVDVTARADRLNGTAPRTGDTDIACNAPTRPAVALFSTYFPDGQIGLRTDGVTAWFDYVFAVEPRPRP